MFKVSLKRGFILLANGRQILTSQTCFRCECFAGVEHNSTDTFQWRSWRFNIQYSPWGTAFELWDLLILHSTLWFTRCCGALSCQSNQEHRSEPHSLVDMRTGFVYARCTTHGTNGFTSHPKDRAIIFLTAKPRHFSTNAFNDFNVCTVTAFLHKTYVSIKP